MSTGRVWATLDPFLERGPTLGRIQANKAFLQALLAQDPFDAYRFYLPSKAAGSDFARLAAELPGNLPGLSKVFLLDRRDLPREIERTPHHAFHLSDCIMHPAYLAAVRNARSRQIFPVTAVTHSLSYARYGQDFLKHLSPCTTPRDAMVATSATAAKVVRGYYGLLRQGYDLDPAAYPEPGVEVIPLGVDSTLYAPADGRKRQELRTRLGFGEETVFLVLARLCLSSKMDFLPLLRAFHRLALAGTPLSAVRLVLAGHAEPDGWGRPTFEELALNIGLALTVIESPSEEAKRELYQAADVFLSPSDNLQETFGLTLLEAQASGLPVVASDFDGYRDLVLPEETGLLARTIGPRDTSDVDLLAPLRFDNHTHLLLAQRLAVDVGGLARAIERLSVDPAARRAMAQAARRHALGYSWEEIARRHVALWETLWERPVPEQPAAAHPMAVDYARVFASYPTKRLAESDTLQATRLGSAVYRGQDHPVVHVGMEDMVDMQAVRSLLVLARKPRPFGELALALPAAVEGIDAVRAETLVLWCLKHDLLELSRG
ncbi:Putative glycosyltransferase EpsD [Fundidesulfovibrio magnetotacticus]|uniref:Glycosyltransferase EpsD n=1 Tax=Fundidesulfovibrio magnetotacticus TaxID=2730080 RepID=A0A6V8M008_9BACT|nr:glycosyltransferase family 4 protein [Fundidesulfovibrio magnetotacticus]GFK96121.1 Putative glycosyltransferase EpsD [Fundidesulfovibrio magnetotacticus]